MTRKMINSFNVVNFNTCIWSRKTEDKSTKKSGKSQGILKSYWSDKPDHLVANFIRIKLLVRNWGVARESSVYVGIN